MILYSWELTIRSNVRYSVHRDREKVRLRRERTLGAALALRFTSASARSRHVASCELTARRMLNHKPTRSDALSAPDLPGGTFRQPVPTGLGAFGMALELEAARREIDRMDERLVESIADRDTVVAQREAAAGERDAALAHRDAAAGERDAARVELAAQKARQLQLVSEYDARVRELGQLNSTLVSTMAQVKRDVERASASRAWRWGHFVTTLGWRLRRRPVKTAGALAAASTRIERLETSVHLGLPAPDPPPSLPAKSVADERRVDLPLSAEEDAAVQRYRAALADRLRERIGPPPERASWPRVSAIVVSRDGWLLLERLIAGLIEHTDYPELEVIVVDNGSEDGSAVYLDGLSPPFPLRTIASKDNLSFAAANAVGAEYATGELLLFMNNDVEPFESGWLKELVAALEPEGVGAVGTTLLHAEPPGAPLDTEPTVQHRAIGLRWETDTVRAFNLGDGDDLWSADFGIERRCFAVTAACMLIERATFDRVGGFEAAYRFGSEDVDLGLKLVRGGSQLAASGRSVLVHRESSTQMREASEFRRVNRVGNRQTLLRRWGPSLTRAYRLGRLRRDPFWTDGNGPHIGITVTDLDPQAGWGDWYTAHDIGDALGALGWRITYLQRRGDDWYSLPKDLDYVLSLMDPFDARQVPEHVTVIAWIRNWTDRWLERPWLQRIDLLLASSAGSAELIDERTGRSPILFPLATNPARFALAESDQSLLCDYVYTGNRWGEERAIERAIAPRKNERFRVFGKGWHDNAAMARYDQGPVGHERLPQVYASAKVVVDDTQSPTLPYGAVNARVLDAIAAGTLVVTDCATGAREMFDDEFPVWDSAATLRTQLDSLLDDEPRRRRLVDRYRRQILRDHTYANRAAELGSILVEHEQRLTFAIKIGAPDRRSAPRWGDLHFADALARELQRLGHRTLVQTLDEWDAEEGLRRDVTIHLKGLTRYEPKPGQFNVLWSVSHPDELSAEECNGFDLICVASPSFAAELGERTTTPVIVLEQATDPRIFRPDPRPELAHDLVYVANSRNVLRPIMRDLLPVDRDLAVWGANWEGLIPSSLVVADHVPNDQLHQIYSSAGIVLCDHWDDMRRHGYVSNRIYDALACGAFVISDDVAGLSERFGEAVVTYRTPAELHGLIDRFLSDPNERRRRAEHGRAVTLEAHTFTYVANSLIDVITPIVAARGSAPASAVDLRS
jgi:GT2 family glycosyltransferase/spore maturation protein CgeB